MPVQHANLAGSYVSAWEAYCKAEKILDASSTIAWLEKQQNVFLIANLKDMSKATTGETRIYNDKHAIIIEIAFNKDLNEATLLQTLNHEIQMHVTPYVDAMKVGKSNIKDLQAKYNKGHPLNYETQHDILAQGGTENYKNVHDTLKRQFPSLSKALDEAHQADVASHKLTRGLGLEGGKVDIEEVSLSEVDEDEFLNNPDMGQLPSDSSGSQNKSDDSSPLSQLSGSTQASPQPNFEQRLMALEKEAQLADEETKGKLTDEQAQPLLPTYQNATEASRSREREIKRQHEEFLSRKEEEHNKITLNDTRPKWQP